MHVLSCNFEGHLPVLFLPIYILSFLCVCMCVGLRGIDK